MFLGLTKMLCICVTPGQLNNSVSSSLLFTYSGITHKCSEKEAILVIKLLYRGVQFCSSVSSWELSSVLRKCFSSSSING